MNDTTEVAAQATAAGAAALFVAATGVEPQAVLWGLIGAIFGVTLAKPSGRFYAMAVFVAATFACALLGTLAGDYMKPGSAPVRNGCALVLGAGFHPLLSAFIGAVPDLLSWAIGVLKRRIPGGE